MTSQDDAVRRSLSALRPDAQEDEHPGADALEAYVEGRLSPEQRAEIDRLALASSIVAEDLADLQAIHQTLAVQPAALRLEAPQSVGDASRSGQARRGVRWGRVAAIAAVAASLVAGIWINQRSTNSTDDLDGRSVTLLGTERARVAEAIRDGRITVPESIAALVRQPGTLLGAPETPARFRLQTPVGSAVSSTTPLFTWDDASAEAYTIAVFDDNFTEVARARVDGTSWRSTVELKRGVTYAWQVTAHRGNSSDTEPKPPRPEARFTIVDEHTAARIAAMEGRLAADPLALGILLAEEGLIVEARRQLMRAADAPGTAETARRLLASLTQGTPITTKPAQ